MQFRAPPWQLCSNRTTCDKVTGTGDREQGTEVQLVPFPVGNGLRVRKPHPVSRSCRCSSPIAYRLSPIANRGFFPLPWLFNSKLETRNAVSGFAYRQSPIAYR